MSLELALEKARRRLRVAAAAEDLAAAAVTAAAGAAGGEGGAGGDGPHFAGAVALRRLVLREVRRAERGCPLERGFERAAAALRAADADEALSVILLDIDASQKAEDNLPAFWDQEEDEEATSDSDDDCAAVDENTGEQEAAAAANGGAASGEAREARLRRRSARFLRAAGAVPPPLALGLRAAAAAAVAQRPSGAAAWLAEEALHLAGLTPQVAALSRAEAGRAAAARLERIAAEKCVALLAALPPAARRIADDACNKGQRRSAPAPPLTRREELSLFAAAVCVGRWGELVRARAGAQRGVAAAHAACAGARARAEAAVRKLEGDVKRAEEATGPLPLFN